MADHEDPTEQVFACDQASAAAALHWITNTLADVDKLTVNRIARAAIELVDNAIKHSSGSKYQVKIVRRFGTIWCEVSDEGTDGDEPLITAGATQDPVHGLAVVEALADEWGSFIFPGSTHVWFQIALPRSAAS